MSSTVTGGVHRPYRLRSSAHLTVGRCAEAGVFSSLFFSEHEGELAARALLLACSVGCRPCLLTSFHPLPFNPDVSFNSPQVATRSTTPPACTCREPPDTCFLCDTGSDRCALLGLVLVPSVIPPLPRRGRRGERREALGRELGIPSDQIRKGLIYRPGGEVFKRELFPLLNCTLPAFLVQTPRCPTRRAGEPHLSL